MTSAARRPDLARLSSWKEIAEYLGTSVRTVQRWERREGLPVHRHDHAHGSTVYAHETDLQQWLQRRTRPAVDRSRGSAPVALARPPEPAPSPLPLRPAAALPGAAQRPAAHRSLSRTGLASSLAVLLVLALLGLARGLAVPGASAARVDGVVALTADGQPKVNYSGGIVGSGGRLYFVEGRGTDAALLEMPMGGGPVRRLLQAWREPLQSLAVFDASPDGRYLLVSSAGSLWLYQIGDGGLRRFGEAPETADGRFSPDGARLALATRTGLRLCDSGGRGMRTIWQAARMAPQKVRWTPDGRRLLFAVLDSQDDRTALWECSADGSGARALLPDFGGEPSDPWPITPDRYLFVAGGQLWSATRPRVWGFAVTPERLTEGPVQFSVPIVVGDRAFAIGDLSRAELVRHSPQSGRWEPFLGGLAADVPDFSADGAWVTYVSHPRGELWRSRSDGSERLQLTAAPTQTFLPRWSPDAATIAFMGRDPGAPWKVYLVARDGGPLQQLVPGTSPEQDPTWSADGRSLFFSAHPSWASGAYACDVSTRRVVPLEGAETVWSLRASRDGRFIVGIDRATMGARLYETAARRWTLLSSERLGFPCWNRASSHVYFIRRNDVVRIDVATRQLEVVASLSSLRMAGTRGPWSLALAPDDTPLTLRDAGVQEVYALSLRP